LASGVAKEYQNMKLDLSSISFTMDKHLAPNPQREFVGHSVVRPLKLLSVRYLGTENFCHILHEPLYYSCEFIAP